MFRRLVTENWQTALAGVLFLLTFAGYVLGVVWAARMKADRARRLAELPLADDAGPPAS